jgi:L-glyceraldehyde 3-phosphate reductase
MTSTAPYTPAADRYGTDFYRRLGSSGLAVPPLSLGFWHNFGDTKSLDAQRGIVRRAFDLGITHFDLANNYGPPYGSAERNFGLILAQDFGAHRDEMVITSKAGWDMWPGPYGDGGSRKYVLASLDQSLRRMGLDYVDIFYSHRFDGSVPLEETMGALAHAVQAGKALYVGVSSYSPDQTRAAAEILRSHGVPLIVHQPAYSMFERTPETSGLLDTLGAEQIGCVVFSPLAQGMLTDRYLRGVPADSRAAVGHFLSENRITESYLTQIRALNELAGARGQTVAQLPLAWVLRRPEVTSAIIGASSVLQLEQNLAALDNLALAPDELDRIEELLAA